MNTCDTLALGAVLNTPAGEAPSSLANSRETRSRQQSTKRKDSVGRAYLTRTASDLRSIVERRFMRMSETHDRIRTELLGRYPTHSR
jgi:hypothetical protein